jgi:F0F1-type ATP synthase assembly protein I
MPANKKPDKLWKGKNLRQLGLLGSIPMLLAAGPLIGFFIGRWLDSQFGTKPFLMLVLLIMGFTAAVMETIRILKEANRDNKDSEL